jgi:hypothetical protein
VLWIAACSACVLAITAAAVYITGRHAAPTAAGKPKVTPRPSASSHRATPQQAIPAQFAGRWSGTVHQSDPALTVTVLITLAGGTAHGTIGYPQLRCAGKLGLVSEGHDHLTLGLTITSGQSSCVNGKVRLAAQRDGSLEFTFLQHGGDDPTGTLTRVS